MSPAPVRSGDDRTRVLIIAHEPIGPRMAGPAIRSWELAQVLSSTCSVTLAAPQVPAGAGHDVTLIPYTPGAAQDTEELGNLAQTAVDVVVCAGHLVQAFPFLRELPVPWVADVYVPIPVESMAWHSRANPWEQAAAHEHTWRLTRTIAQHADLLLCASKRQRDFWLGALAALGRLKPELYRADPSLGNLVAVVPFGCQAFPPARGNALKGVWPGIGRNDRVILWGGGVWNWFDPLTLLQAMAQVIRRHPRARLVFLGVNHPNPELVPEMEAAREVRELSRDLGLDGATVFWGDWVPYAERGEYLLEADLGVSLHRAGIEGRLAFRTRLLDAIWAGMPMVLTRGDVLSAEFEMHGLGLGVEPGDVDAVAAAICALLDEPDARRSREDGFERLRSKYRWERVAEPLARFCEAPSKAWDAENVREVAGTDATLDQAALQMEIARLEQTVRGYESGRLMRVVSAMHRMRHRLRRS